MPSEIRASEGNTNFLKERFFMLLLSFAACIAVYHLLPLLFLVSFMVVKIIKCWFCSSSKHFTAYVIS